MTGPAQESPTTAGDFSAGFAFRAFTPFAVGYFLASIFRSINAVIAPELARDFEIGGAGLGFAVSAFFLSATLFQLPYGMLLDRYDPWRLYASMLLFSALGAVLSAVAENVLVFALGRALVALGLAASGVTSFKVHSLWLPAERLPLANGLSLAAGGLGLMAGTAPIASRGCRPRWLPGSRVALAWISTSAGGRTTAAWTIIIRSPCLPLCQPRIPILEERRHLEGPTSDRGRPASSGSERSAQLIVV